MAFQTPRTPELLQGFEHIAEYQDYAYASNSQEEAVAHKVNGRWQILCKDSKRLKTIELVNECQVPTVIARHLKVLSKLGVSQEMFVADI